MAHQPVEEVRVLYLDRKNRLMADERQGRGTVDHTPLYPREVVKRALELGASALIVVHNHPSGDPTPSQADIAMTRQLTAAAAALGLVLHHPLIVPRGGPPTLRSPRLLSRHPAAPRDPRPTPAHPPAGTEGLSQSPH